MQIERKAGKADAPRTLTVGTPTVQTIRISRKVSKKQTPIWRGFSRLLRHGGDSGGAMKRLEMNCVSKLVFRLVFVTAVLAAASPAMASIVVYPGAAPCNSTLQGCINAVSSGDVIQTNASYIDESISINKSLTLMPFPGETFVALGGGVTPRSVNITNGPNGETVNVVLSQLLIDPGYINIDFQLGSGHSVAIRDSLITAALNSTGTRGIDLDVRTSASIIIERNLIQSHGYPIYFLTLGNLGDSISLSVISNRIYGGNSAYSSAGIDLDMRGAGAVQATVQSNVIWGVAYCNCGNPTAIGIYTTDSVQGYVRVGNNTIDQVGGVGIYDVGAFGTSSQQTFINNNIITHCTSGMVLPAYDSDLYISHNYNDFFANTGSNIYGGYLPGPQTYNFDPLNADQGFGAYALQPNSPAIDLGNASAAGGISLADASFKPRVLGFNVDLGANESSFVSGFEYMILREEFGTHQLPSEYTYPKGTWMDDAYSLIGYGDKKAAFVASPALAGCDTCKIEAIVKTGNNSGSRMWVQGWYIDKKNLVELLIKEGSDKLVLRQKLNGAVVTKTKVSAPLEPFAEYRIKLIYDGFNFLVFLNGTQVITMPSTGSPYGTFGFQSKGDYGYLGNIYIHY